eukprot:8012018-Pyramimonas_sp.AAC.1
MVRERCKQAPRRSKMGSKRRGSAGAPRSTQEILKRLQGYSKKTSPGQPMLPTQILQRRESTQSKRLPYFAPRAPLTSTKT